MNIYVDTNVIISFVEQDVNYNKALKIREINDLITSEVTVLELNSFFSRKLKDEILTEASTKYAIRATNVRVVEIDMNKLFRKALEFSTKLQLKTLDVLQISSALLLNAKSFITFDKDILKKRDLIEKITKILVSDLQP
ncbi:putative nucleic acid-binding protein, contains PIN domain [Metallosphaera yellowstonensis MK1]|uniref:Putative nucleic acid-binding protein, contains PIN domain n=1 Tax=Metallosphaera yellowstonensis MK1 TaxID=671065 RepID=H2C9Q0_9CREN|nr:PIN domain-containing protein [Metallosphaera yellowstonensis]EHP68876.1 putative nucleic acid-binding protein, contains PIN domain [Metallosphaera yellowstonensis MK1]